MRTPMPTPIAHVKPQSPRVTVEEGDDRMVKRADFIREEASEFMHDILRNLTQICTEDLQKIADACINTDEYIWEESRRITR